MAEMYVTPAGAGVKDGSTWAKAFGEAEFEADLEAGAEAGDIYYVAAGAAHGDDAVYTLDSAYDASARDGTAVGPVSIIGVKYGTTAMPPTIADWPTVKKWTTSDDRPVFTCAANAVTLGDYYKIYNCVFNGTAAAVITTAAQNIFYNCRVTNTSGTANRYGFIAAARNLIVNCDVSSTAGRAISNSGGNVYILFCYLHDSETAIYSVGSNYLSGVIGNVIDTVTTGIALTTSLCGLILNNTFYSATTHVSASTAYPYICINNIMDTCTDAFKWTTQTDINFFAYNHKGNSVTDMWELVEESAAPHKDMWATAQADPVFTDAAGGDLSLAEASPCIDAGMAMLLGVS